MNKHKKMAILIAPFLAIGGYIATDYYDKYQMNKKKYHQITVQGNCDIDNGKCLLKGAGLLLEYSKIGDLTNIESNYPLDSAAISMTNGETKQPYNLKPNSDKKNWTINTAEYALLNKDPNNKIRIIVSANDHLFFSEFRSTLPK